MAWHGERGELRMIARRIPRSMVPGGIDANTILMLHGENFADASLNPKIVTNNGLSISNDGKFGSCIYMSGAGTLNSTKWLQVTLGNYLPSTFTIDFWMKLVGNMQYAAIGTLINTSDWNSKGSAGHWMLNMGEGDPSKVQMRIYHSPTNIDRNSINISTPTDSAWHHYAWVNNVNVHIFYYDGNAKLSFSTSEQIIGTFGIGRGDTRGYGITGGIDELRVSNIARWTDNFTPPIAPYSR